MMNSGGSHRRGRGWTVEASRRVYRVLLRAYPGDIRQRYGEEMVGCFSDACRDAVRSNGPRGLAALWLRTLSDLTLTALKERSTTLNRTVYRSIFGVALTTVMRIRVYEDGSQKLRVSWTYNVMCLTCTRLRSAHRFSHYISLTSEVTTIGRCLGTQRLADAAGVKQSDIAGLSTLCLAFTTHQRGLRPVPSVSTKRSVQSDTCIERLGVAVGEDCTRINVAWRT